MFYCQFCGLTTPVWQRNWIRWHSLTVKVCAACNDKEKPMPNISTKYIEDA